jgi:hypothetical protein
MQDAVLRRVTELPPEARRAMELILGRALEENEAVVVSVCRPAPSDIARQEASQLLLERVRRTAKRATGVPEDETEATIDEAVEYVRHHSE